jgi:acetyl-CoA C-acetyltransferase
MIDPIVIVGAARTPMGGFQGDLTALTAAQLGAVAIRAAVERAGLPPERIDEVLMGCVLPAGQGQAPARQAALGAGLPLGAGCTTVNKMCGSGMRAAMFAHDMLLAGGVEAVVRKLTPSCCPRRAAATGLATAKSRTTCFSTAWRTPTRKVG